MIIHRLSVSGFKIMGTPLNLRFPEEGKIGIIGANESGKSTLLEAIAFALYGLRRGTGPAGEMRENLVTWGKANARLEIEFSSGEYRYILERRIGVKSGHSASLTTFQNGEEVGRETNIRQIEERIEQTTGMDRDSFTKLVYIRQKDLDALKELGRTRREQLVNKVMGIEVFDTSTNAVKKDLKELRINRDSKDEQLKLAQRDRERYEEGLKRQNGLKEELESLQLQNKRLGKELEDKNRELQAYYWLFEKTSTEELLEEKKRWLEKIEKSAEELAELEKRIRRREKMLKENAPVFTALEETIEEYRGYTERLRTGRMELEDAKKQVTQELQSLNLPEEECILLSSDLSAKRRTVFWRVVVTAIGGAASLAAALSLGSGLVFAAAILLAVSFFSLRGYLKLERLAERSSRVQSLFDEIRRREESQSRLGSEFKDVRANRGYESIAQVEEKKREIISSLERQTGHESIEALKAAIRVDKDHQNGLREESGQIERAKEELKQTQKKLDTLLESCPEGVEGFTYTKEAHEEVRIAQEQLEDQYNRITSKIASSQASVAEIEKTLKDTGDGYLRYPSLKEDVEALDRRIRLHERVGTEFGETSKGLRERVLPHAAYVINHILPDITDGRYSDLKISEDLQFTVHSMEAGDYKDRDVFSGGTQDQFLIALRLAFTQSILDSRTQADNYCLLMDECISSSDEARKQGIFSVLEAMKNTFRQIFIIAHEDISSLVDYHLVLVRNENGHTQVSSKSW